MKKYPIGARWELIKNEAIYYITFSRMSGNIEVWLFGKMYSDGSGHRFDWAKSYQSAKKYHYTTGRFKRVKNP